MMVAAERFEDLQPVALATNWRGRSGRFYALAQVPLTAFSLAPGDLYLLASGSAVLWVGGAADIVGDATARASFRAAIASAAAAFRAPAPGDPVDRMTMMWDLERAEPVSGLTLT